MFWWRLLKIFFCCISWKKAAEPFLAPSCLTWCLLELYQRGFIFLSLYEPTLQHRFRAVHTSVVYYLGKCQLVFYRKPSVWNIIFRVQTQATTYHDSRAIPIPLFPQKRTQPFWNNYTFKKNKQTNNLNILLTDESKIFPNIEWQNEACKFNQKSIFKSFLLSLSLSDFLYVSLSLSLCVVHFIHYFSLYWWRVNPQLCTC